MRRITSTLALTAAGAIALSACGSAESDTPKATKSAEQSTSSEKKMEKPSIVASSNVWGSVAQAVAGDNDTVTSIISSPDQDPHDYQATAKDKLAFSKATVVIVNGGGYDDWATKLAESASSKPQILDAVKISGLQKEGEKEFNEHVFYSLATAEKMANQIKDILVKAQPDRAKDFEANTEKFLGQLKELKERTQKFGAEHKDVMAIATEPVTGYLMDDMGIKNVTPEEFVEQSESDAGPSAEVTNEAVKLLSEKKANLLVLNGQTQDAVSKKLQDAAKAAGTPVALVFETFPEGVNDYQGFIGGAIDAFEKAMKK